MWTDYINVFNIKSTKVRRKKNHFEPESFFAELLKMYEHNSLKCSCRSKIWPRNTHNFSDTRGHFEFANAAYLRRNSFWHIQVVDNIASAGVRVMKASIYKERKTDKLAEPWWPVRAVS